jgi:hypothetical protein
MLSLWLPMAGLTAIIIVNAICSGWQGCRRCIVRALAIGVYVCLILAVVTVLRAAWGLT